MRKDRHQRKLGSSLRKAYRQLLIRGKEEVRNEGDKIRFELGLKLESKDNEIKSLRKELKQVSKEKNKEVRALKQSTHKHWEVRIELEDQRDKFIIRSKRLVSLISQLQRIAGENDISLRDAKRLEKKSDKLIEKEYLDVYTICSEEE